MRRALALVLAAGLAAPAAAQSWDGFFGLRAEDVQGLVARAMAQQREDEARAAAAQAAQAPEPATPKNDTACIFRDVARHMGVTVDPSAPLPTFRYASRETLKAFQDAVAAEYGNADGYSAISNMFLPWSAGASVHVLPPVQ
ncbi:MAG: hypothetical protein KGL53_14105, partial [Elusimicrobia bacterium]|nr:hypothetical protein [Elusimicrobiota bacterium]